MPALIAPENGWLGSYPTLSALYDDVEGSAGSVEFEVTGVGSYSVSATDGAIASYTPYHPDGQALINGTYSWRARNFDGNSYSAWSSWRTLTIDQKVLFSDNWTGNEAVPWDTSKWSTAVGSPNSRVDISGNEGRLYVAPPSSGTNGDARAIAQMPALSDTEVLLRYSFADRLARSRLRIDLRADGTSSLISGYRVEIQSDGSTVRLKRISGGSSTTVDDSFTYAKNTSNHWLRFRVQGSVVSYKLWADGTAEPSTWSRQWTDPSPLPSGVLELQHDWTQGSRAVLLDNLAVSDVFEPAPSSGTSGIMAYGVGPTATSVSSDASIVGIANALRRRILGGLDQGPGVSLWRCPRSRICQRIRERADSGDGPDFQPRWLLALRERRRRLHLR